MFKRIVIGVAVLAVIVSTMGTVYAQPPKSRQWLLQQRRR
jgi:hypothetical protein